MTRITQDEYIKSLTSITIHHLIKFILEEREEYACVMKDIKAIKNDTKREKALLEYSFTLALQFVDSYIKTKTDDKKSYDANLKAISKALDDFKLKLLNITKTKLRAH